MPARNLIPGPAPARNLSRHPAQGPSLSSSRHPAHGPVRNYYSAHFAELTPEKKFHFATRMKNYFHCDDFATYFAKNQPSSDLRPLLANNDFSRVNHLAARRPYFLKYPELYGLDLALFRVHHLRNEYNLDLRPDLLELIPLKNLHQLSDDLLADDGAIAALSTWAVNVICLVEEFFPRGHDPVRLLAEKSLALERNSKNLDPLLALYLYTHIILCDSNFYTRPLTEPALAREMLARCAKIIEQNFDQLILDVRLEFLVCANLATPLFPELRSRIAAECRAILAKNPFIMDPRRDQSRHNLNGCEHTNALFIMSGLDTELNRNRHPQSPKTPGLDAELN